MVSKNLMPALTRGQYAHSYTRFQGVALALEACCLCNRETLQIQTKQNFKHKQLASAKQKPERTLVSGLDAAYM